MNTAMGVFLSQIALRYFRFRRRGVGGRSPFKIAGKLLLVGALLFVFEIGKPTTMPAGDACALGCAKAEGVQGGASGRLLSKVVKNERNHTWITANAACRKTCWKKEGERRGQCRVHYPSDEHPAKQRACLEQSRGLYQKCKRDCGEHVKKA